MSGLTEQESRAIMSGLTEQETDAKAKGEPYRLTERSVAHTFLTSQNGTLVV